MKKVGILIFAVALVIGLVASNLFPFGHIGGNFIKFSMDFGGVRGNGHVIKEQRSVSSFNEVEAGGIFQVEVVAQKETGVEIEADENLLPFITTSVHDGILSIETEKRIRSGNPIKVRVSAPDIEKLDISGAATVNVSGLNNDALTVEGSGASKISISGKTTRVEINVSGATKVLADELKADDASIDASGASQIFVNVSKSVHSDLSGASKVVYSGSPADVVTSASGASKVSAK